MKRSYIGVLFVFLAGILLGVVGGQFRGFCHFGCHGGPRAGVFGDPAFGPGDPHHGPFKGEFGPPHGPPPPPTADMVLERLTRDLELTPQQQESLKPIVFEMHSKMEALRKEHEPQMRVIVDEAFEKAAPTLNPDQKDKFISIVSRFRRATPAPVGTLEGMPSSTTAVP